MITVSIDLSSQLKTKSNKNLDTIELQSPCSVQDCVRMVAGDGGKDFAEFLFSEDGTLRPTILLSVNDAQLFWDDPYLLSDGDRVSILSPIAGG